jgi:hypothetical protein
MAKRLDDDSRNILEFRPDIDFVEPEVEPAVPRPVPEPLQPEEILEDIRKTKALAKAVSTLAATVQARADVKAQNMVISLDPKVDAPTIAAMKRMFPDDNPTKITYDQYRDCKDKMLEKGREVAKQGIIKPEEVQDAKENARNMFTDIEAAKQTGFFGTPEAREGGLRPDLFTRGQIIEPLDIDQVQNFLICILMDFVWKIFIVKALEGIPGASRVLPEKLSPLYSGCKGFKVGDLLSLGVPLLGEKKPKIQIPKIPKDIGDL